MNVQENYQSFPTDQPLLPRTEVYKLLDEATKKMLTVLIAGAGYSKTLTMRSYLEDRQKNYVWLYMSQLNNIIPRFWRGLCIAFNEVYPGIKTELTRLGFPGTLEKYDQFLQILAKHLYSDEQVIFVVDDFHWIDNPIIHEFIERLIDARIENLSIIIITRSDLPFGVNALYNRGDLTWITSKQLAFSKDEISDYFQRLELDLDETTVDEIYQSTEGWPIAVYFIATNAPRDKAIIYNPVKVTLPFLFQLFEKEFFQLLSPEDRLLFVKLSLLEDFSLEVYEKIAGVFDNAHVSTLSSNLYMSYDDNMETYYFHNLIHEFLKTKQNQLTDEERGEVFETAAIWCEKKEYLLDAITYFMKDGNYLRAWNIIKHFEINIPLQEANRILDFIDDFPEDFKQSNPYIQLVIARLYLNNGDLEKSKVLLLSIIENCESREMTKKNKEIVGEASIFLGFVAMTERNTIFLDYFKQASECLPNGSTLVDNRLQISDGNFSINLTEHSVGAVERYESLLDEAVSYMSQVMHGAGYSCAALARAEAGYYSADFKKTIHHAYEAIYKSQTKNQLDVFAMAHFFLIKANVATGNYQDIKTYLSELRTKIKASDSSQCDPILDMIEGWFYTQMGMTHEVAPWILSESESVNMQSPNSTGRDRLIRLKCYFADEKYLELSALIDYLEEFYSTRQLFLPSLIVCVYKAVTSYRLDNYNDFVSSFEKAYELSVDNNLFMPFIELGNATRAMANALLKNGNTGIPDAWLRNISVKSATYAKRLTYIKTKFMQEYSNAENERSTLTKREKDILLSLSQGLTRDEIASSHHISINTVKSELRTIYNKLGAINSADAVRIASVLGLF